MNLRDRRFGSVLAVRSGLCLVLTFAPLWISIPAQHEVVSIAYLFPVVSGVVGAVALRERVQWLRPRNRMLWWIRGGATLVSDLVCVAGLIATIDGWPERAGILAGALLAITVGMGVVCVAQDVAWLAAAAVGFACLIAGERPLVHLLPLPLVLTLYGGMLILYAIKGPAAQ